MNYQRLSRFPFDIFPENKCRGLAVPTKRSDSPFLSTNLHFFESLSVVILPWISYLEKDLLYPLLLDLEASRILSLTFYALSSSSMPPVFLAFISARDFDLLLFLILSSTKLGSTPCFSRTSLKSSIVLFLL